MYKKKTDFSFTRYFNTYKNPGYFTHLAPVRDSGPAVKGTTRDYSISSKSSNAQKTKKIGFFEKVKNIFKKVL